MLLKMYVKFQALMSSEEGQDLVEYAMLIALIALVLIASVGKVASALSTTFTNISTRLAGV
jgi:pilus assembly protein Flp/PilA